MSHCESCERTYSRSTGQNAAIGGFSLISTNGHRVLIPDQCGSYPLSPLPCPSLQHHMGLSISQCHRRFSQPHASWFPVAITFLVLHWRGGTVLYRIVSDTQSGRVRPSSASALIAQSHSQTLRHVPRMNWFLHG